MDRSLKPTKIITAVLLFMTLLNACKKDEVEEPELSKPKVENVELGLGDAGIAVIGEDFHFNADLLAVNKLDTVQIRIRQRAGESYSKAWTHEITWMQYKGLRNANVHKHFAIPADAAEGKYDFVVIVKDEDGSRLELKRDFEIYTRANLPVRPMITGFWVHKNWNAFYDYHHDKDKNPTERYKKGDTMQAQVNISFVKGDGKLYVLLIKKSANYNPKTIEEVDLSRAIAYDVFEHKNEATVFDFSNVLFDDNTFTLIKGIPDLVIGAAKDNNAPTPNDISGSKAWQTGDYNLVVIYKNTTYNITLHRTVTFGVDYN